MSNPGVQATPEDPAFIKYLLNPQLKYKCHFLVGNEALNIAVERIGVVKKMLIAHSNVLRIALEESPIAEKDNVPVTDIYPDTFRNVLRYVYGYDNTTSLTFTDADNLLYAAEKYNILSLKGKVCSRLMSLLNCDNICGLLNNPACFQTLELNAAITQILKAETDKVLSSPQFLELSPKAFLHILQQERVQVPEIELWRSAIKWAKNRVGSEDGPSLRAELTEHVNHIRVCALPYKEFCSEVAPSRVLTGDEVALVCVSHGTKQVQQELTEVCSEVITRPPSVVSSEPLQVTLNYIDKLYKHTSTASIITKQSGIKLMTMRFYPRLQEAAHCSVFVRGIQDTEINFTIKAQDNRMVDIPIRHNGKALELIPNSEYKVTVTADTEIGALCHEQQTIGFDDFSVHFNTEYDGFYICHFGQIKYIKLSLV